MHTVSRNAILLSLIISAIVTGRGLFAQESDGRPLRQIPPTTELAEVTLSAESNRVLDSSYRTRTRIVIETNLANLTREKRELEALRREGLAARVDETQRTAYLDEVKRRLEENQKNYDAMLMLIYQLGLAKELGRETEIMDMLAAKVAAIPAPPESRPAIQPEPEPVVTTPEPVAVEPEPEEVREGVRVQTAGAPVPDSSAAERIAEINTKYGTNLPENATIHTIAEEIDERNGSSKITIEATVDGIKVSVTRTRSGEAAQVAEAPQAAEPAPVAEAASGPTEIARINERYGVNLPEGTVVTKITERTNAQGEVEVIIDATTPEGAQISAAAGTAMTVERFPGGGRPEEVAAAPEAAPQGPVVYDGSKPDPRVPSIDVSRLDRHNRTAYEGWLWSGHDQSRRYRTEPEYMEFMAAQAARITAAGKKTPSNNELYINYFRWYISATPTSALEAEIRRQAKEQELQKAEAARTAEMWEALQQLQAGR